MGCKSCGGHRYDSEKYEVILESGRIVYVTSNEGTAKAVAKRYPTATVRLREKAKGG